MRLWPIWSEIEPRAEGLAQRGCYLEKNGQRNRQNEDGWSRSERMIRDDSPSGLMDHGLDGIRVEVNGCADAALVCWIVGASELDLARARRRFRFRFPFRDAAA